MIALYKLFNEKIKKKTRQTWSAVHLINGLDLPGHSPCEFRFLHNLSNKLMMLKVGWEQHEHRTSSHFLAIRWNFNNE